MNPYIPLDFSEGFELPAQDAPEYVDVMDYID